MTDGDKFALSKSAVDGVPTWGFGAKRASANGPIQFQITGDAGRIFAIQSSTNLSSASWMTSTNVLNPAGTAWFTNSDSMVQTQQFFRARLLP
jgi:hypothetical protein